MKSTELFSAIAGINEKYAEESEFRAKSHLKAYKYIAAAASAAIIIAVALAVIPIFKSDIVSPPEESAAVIEESKDKSKEESKTEEQSIEVSKEDTPNGEASAEELGEDPSIEAEPNEEPSEDIKPSKIVYADGVVYTGEEIVNCGCTHIDPCLEQAIDDPANEGALFAVGMDVFNYFYDTEGLSATLDLCNQINLYNRLIKNDLRYKKDFTKERKFYYESRLYDIKKSFNERRGLIAEIIGEDACIKLSNILEEFEPIDETIFESYNSIIRFDYHYSERETFIDSVIQKYGSTVPETEEEILIDFMHKFEELFDTDSSLSSFCNKYADILRGTGNRDTVYFRTVMEEKGIKIESRDNFPFALLTKEQILSFTDPYLGLYLVLIPEDPDGEIYLPE